MKESYWGYWLIVLGIFVVVVLLLVQSFTSTNTQDYYMVKTITEAAMEDAIDYSYYRNFGEAKINKEKFRHIYNDDRSLTRSMQEGILFSYYINNTREKRSRRRFESSFRFIRWRQIQILQRICNVSTCIS